MADAQLSLTDLAAKMRGIDIAHLTKVGDGGMLDARPMSNNGQVDYDGTSYYFSDGDTTKVERLGRDATCSLSFSGDGVWVEASGAGERIRDIGQFKAHLSPDLDKWFADGIDTPGLVLIKVIAERIRYWAGEDEGVLEL